jgi:hypothetical protein
MNGSFRIPQLAELGVTLTATFLNSPSLIPRGSSIELFLAIIFRYLYVLIFMPDRLQLIPRARG